MDAAQTQVGPTTQAGGGPPGWVSTARDLYLVAIALFVVNILIGILNGADAVEFDRNQILTHVHAGTVGWLTLAIVASTFILFQAADRRLMLALAVLVPVYVLAFYTGNLAFRAIGGLALLLAIAWLLVWVWQTYLAGDRTLPRLAVVLGLTSFGYGALIGVLIQISLAAGMNLLPGDSVGAHAGAMTFGYLVLVAMGFIEYRILGTTDLPRRGLVQIGALFLGGLIISVSLLAGAGQQGGGIYLVTQLIAVVLFVMRVWPRSLVIDWLAATPLRHFAAASIWVVIALGLFMYLVFSFISAADPNDPDAFPLNVLVASDHAAYIGIITNIALGFLLALLLRAEVRRGWMGQLIFWGVNLGLIVFALGLILESDAIKRIGAPVMGIALLASLAILAYAAMREPLVNTEADLETG
ncbi:MAG TPA: hypothetical protein VIB02_11715 [Candidatus Limnocylindrales bacterium]|jgi:hypothetical protein